MCIICIFGGRGKRPCSQRPNNRCFYFTVFPPGYRTCPFQYQLNSLGSILPAAITGNCSNTSNHCSTRYPFTPQSRECTCRWSVLPKDTVLHHGSQEPYPRPLTPMSQAIVIVPWRPACIWSIHFRCRDNEGGHLQGACHSCGSFTSHWKSVRQHIAIYLVMRDMRDTQSPKLNGKK